MDSLLLRKRKRRSPSKTWMSPMSSTVTLGSYQPMIGLLTSTSGKSMVRKSKSRSLGNSYVIAGRIEEAAEQEMDHSPASIMKVSSKSSHKEWWALLLAIVSAQDLRAASNPERKTIFLRMVDRLKVVEGSLSSFLIFSTKLLTETRKVALQRKPISWSKRMHHNLCFLVRKRKNLSSKMLLLYSQIRLEYSTNNSNSSPCLSLTKQTSSRWLWVSLWTPKLVSLQWTRTNCNSYNRLPSWTSKWWRPQRDARWPWWQGRCISIRVQAYS